MSSKRFLVLLTPLLAFSLVALTGCGGNAKGPRKEVEEEKSGTPEGEGGGGGAVTMSDYTGTIEGRVEFTGPPDQGKPAMKEPDKNKTECPSAVAQSGWYTQESSDKKGVRYAVVFLRPAGGVGKLPKVNDKVLALRGGTSDKPGPEFVEVHQPHCQFEPRVVVVLANQKVRGTNDSNPPISHDFSLAGKFNYTATLSPGSKAVHDPNVNDKSPYQVVCNQHTSFMNGYVWKFSHPFATVTDADGRFTIHNVPATSEGLELVVWQEKIDTRGNIKVIGPLALGADKKMTKTISLP